MSPRRRRDGGTESWGASPGRAFARAVRDLVGSTFNAPPAPDEPGPAPTYRQVLGYFGGRLGDDKSVARAHARMADAMGLPTAATARAAGLDPDQARRARGTFMRSLDRWKHGALNTPGRQKRVTPSNRSVQRLAELVGRERVRRRRAATLDDVYQAITAHGVTVLPGFAPWLAVSRDVRQRHITTPVWVPGPDLVVPVIDLQRGATKDAGEAFFAQWAERYGVPEAIVLGATEGTPQLAIGNRTAPRSR